MTDHICPADHAHASADTLTCYVTHKCRCIDCRDLSAAYASWRRHMQLTGQNIKISALGTQRRIQALMAIGWSMTAIAAHFDDRRGNVRRLLNQTTITTRFAATIARTYDELSMQMPTGHDKHSASTIARTRAFAKRRGWLPPLAWDDIDTDPGPATSEPDAENDTDAAPVSPDRSADIDEVAVALATDGHRVRLTPLERRACVRILHARFYSDGLIADTIRCDIKTVERIREELGLPAHELADLITRRAA